MTLTPEIVAEMERLHKIATEVDPTDWVGALAAAERLDVLRVEHTTALLAAYAEAERLREANRLLADEVRAVRWVKKSKEGQDRLIKHRMSATHLAAAANIVDTAVAEQDAARAAVDAAGLLKEGE